MFKQWTNYLPISELFFFCTRFFSWQMAKRLADHLKEIHLSRAEWASRVANLRYKPCSFRCCDCKIKTAKHVNVNFIAKVTCIIHMSTVFRSSALWMTMSYHATWWSCRTSLKGRNMRNWVLQQSLTTASMNHTSCQAQSNRKDTVVCSQGLLPVMFRRRKHKLQVFLAVGMSNSVSPRLYLHPILSLTTNLP